MIDLWWLPVLTLLLLHKWQISWNHQESADCHLDLPGSVDSNWSQVFYRILAPICRNDQTNSHNTRSVVWWHLLLQTYIAATMAIFRSPPSLITKLLTFWKVIFCVTNWYRPKNVKWECMINDELFGFQWKKHRHLVPESLDHISPHSLPVDLQYLASKWE